MGTTWYTPAKTALLKVLAGDWNDQSAYIRAHTREVTEVTGATQAIANNYHYIANYATLVTFTLPATATVGDIIAVTGLGTGGWLIAQNASQLIKIGATVSATGTGGSVASSNANDSVTLMCTTTNTVWTAISVVGNLTVVTA